MPTHVGWNRRYRSEGYPAGTEAARILQEFLPLLPRGRALDLAVGAGRNAVFLASHGWSVLGIDSSDAALEQAAALARDRGISVEWASAQALRTVLKGPGVVLFPVDLETWKLPAEQFELIVCINYLQRSLFDPIERALRSGGMVVYETYTLKQLNSPAGPHNPDYLLREHELRTAFPGLETIFHREIQVGKGIASLLARKF